MEKKNKDYLIKLTLQILSIICSMPNNYLQKRQASINIPKTQQAKSELFTDVKEIPPLVCGRQTKVRTSRVQARVVHNRGKIPIPGVKASDSNAKVKITIQNSSQLWSNSHPRCESVRPKLKNIEYNNGLVHNWGEIFPLCMKSSVQKCKVLIRFTLKNSKFKSFTLYILYFNFLIN